MSKLKRYDWSKVEWATRDVDIARALGCTREAVRKQRLLKDSPTRRLGRPPLDWDSVDWDRSNADIAIQLGCTAQAVNLQRRARGLGPPPVPRAKRRDSLDRQPAGEALLRALRLAWIGTDPAPRLEGLPPRDLHRIAVACKSVTLAAFQLGGLKRFAPRLAIAPRTGQNQAVRDWVQAQTPVRVFTSREACHEIPGYTLQQIQGALSRCLASGTVTCVLRKTFKRPAQYRRGV